MSNKSYTTVVGLVVALMMVTTFAAAPALAQSDDDSSDDPDNFICSSTHLSSILSDVLQLIVVLGAGVAVIGGTAFTVADAARPGGEADYKERRNQCILWGGGALIVMYGADALISQVEQNLSYECILPFTGE